MWLLNISLQVLNYWPAATWLLRGFCLQVVFSAELLQFCGSNEANQRLDMLVSSQTVPHTECGNLWNSYRSHSWGLTMLQPRKKCVVCSSQTEIDQDDVKAQRFPNWKLDCENRQFQKGCMDDVRPFYTSARPKECRTAALDGDGYVMYAMCVMND